MDKIILQEITHAINLSLTDKFHKSKLIEAITDILAKS